MKDIRFNSLKLTNNPHWVVEKITNYTKAEYELSLATNPYLDGDILQNKRMLPRDMEITLKPTDSKGDYDKINMIPLEREEGQKARGLCIG